MDGRFQPTSPARVVGRDEMRALASSVLGALERAGLQEVMIDLNRRVLNRAPEELYETAETNEAVLHLTYKPIVELVLYEVRDLARMPHLSAEHRRDRIAWTLTIAGL